MKHGQPNLLLLTTDEQRYDFVGTLGPMPVITPTLDWLASEGAHHSHAYTVNPVCMPARCSLLTGLYSHQHGIMNNRGDLNPNLPTVPQALQSLGYQTALIGKEHFFEGFLDFADAKPHTQKAFGWDHLWSVAGKSMVAGLPGFSDCSEDNWTRYLERNGLLDTYRESTCERMGMRKRGECEAGASVLEEEHHVDYRITEESLSYLEDRERSKPFFLWTSFCSPHFPFDPPVGYLQKYDPRDMPVPVECPPDKVAHYQRYLAAYCAMVEQLDTYIGRIIELLRSQNELDNTLIVFLSDHGDMMGDFGLFAKNFPYDGSSRVPFIARYPGVIPRTTYTQATEITDVAATFLDAAGADDLHSFLPESPSKSLIPLWGDEDFPRQYAFCENGYQFEAPFEMLVDQNWKYVFFSFSGEELLYNLQDDPEERTNLAANSPERLAEFRRLLLKRKASTPPPIPAEWIYQRINGTDGPNPHRCHHGGLPEYPNQGIATIE